MSAYQSKKGGNHANDESLYANIIIFPIFAFVTMRTFNPVSYTHLTLPTT